MAYVFHVGDVAFSARPDGPDPPRPARYQELATTKAAEPCRRFSRSARTPARRTCGTAEGRLEFNLARSGISTILTVFGEVDIATADQLADRLARVLAPGVAHLIVDLTGVEFLGVAGLNTLLDAHHRACGAPIDLVCQKGIVRKTLEIGGHDMAFPLHSSVVDAITAGQRTLGP
jgi:anti-sigma B factor antagonist